MKTSNLEQLRAAGLRATPARIAFLRLLSQTRRPQSAEGLWQALRSQGADRVTIYRIADDLSRAGLVKPVELRHGHVHYELNDAKNHHHHLVCEVCGKIQDVHLTNDNQLIKHVTKQYHFQPSSHSFEIFGRCANCQ